MGFLRILRVWEPRVSPRPSSGGVFGAPCPVGMVLVIICSLLGGPGQRFFNERFEVFRTKGEK